MMHTVKNRAYSMRLILPLIAFLSIAACSSTQVQTASVETPTPNCMTRENIAAVLTGQGLAPVVLNDQQNAAWHAYDAANAPQPDAAGFTYVIGLGSTPQAVIVGFSPDGCAAYYVPVPREVVVAVIGEAS